MVPELIAAVIALTPDAGIPERAGPPAADFPV